MSNNPIMITPGDNLDDDGKPLDLFDYLVNELDNRDIVCTIRQLGDFDDESAVARAERAIDGKGTSSGDLQSDVTDLLTDLRHFCDARGFDFGHLNAVSFSHYCEENGTEQTE